MNQGICVKCGEPLEEAGGTYMDGRPIPEKTYRRYYPHPRGFLCFNCYLDTRPKKPAPSPTESDGGPTWEDIIEWNNRQSKERDERRERYE